MKIIMTLLIVLASLLVYGRARNNVILTLIGGVPIMIGCLIAIVIGLVQLWMI